MSFDKGPKNIPLKRWSTIQFAQIQNDQKFYLQLLLNDQPIGDCSGLMQNNNAEKIDYVKAGVSFFTVYSAIFDVLWLWQIIFKYLNSLSYQ